MSVTITRGVRQALLAVLTCLAVALAGLGALPSATAATPGTITGTVRSGGVPVAGVRISVETRQVAADGNETWTDVQVTPAVTDSAGRYTVSVAETAAGAEGYVVGFHADGYATRYYDDARSREDATRLRITSGKQEAGIDAALVRAGAAAGVVTNTAGEPISGVTVTALSLRVTAAGLRTWEPVPGAAAVTNGHGVYRLEAPTGRYRLQFSAPGGFETRYYPNATVADEGEFVAFVAGQLTPSVNASLPKKGRVLGSLVEADGSLTAEENAEVELWREYTWTDNGERDSLPHTSWTMVATDDVESGRFSLDVPGGTYRLKVLLDDGSAGFLPGYVGLDEAPSLTVASEETLRMAPSVLPVLGTLSGRVRVDGSGIKDARVALHQSLVEQIVDGVPQTPVREIEWRPTQATATAADGTWQLQARHATYRLDARTPVNAPVAYHQWYDGVTLFRDATTLRMVRSLSGLDFAWGKSAVAVVRDPWIAGHNKQGNTLTAHLGTWAPADAALTVQWYAGGTPVAGATGTTLTIPKDLLGGTSASYSIAVTATRSGYLPTTVRSLATTPFTSDLLGGGTPALENRALPRLDGSPRVGDPISSTTGEWSVTPGTLTRQWLVGGVPVTGATGATYTPSAADLGKSLQVKVTEASGATATSTASAPVRSGSLVSLATPAITGTPQVGRPLTAGVGSWSVADTAHTFQWYRDGIAVPGATAATFTPGAGDEGSRMSVAVTASKAGYEPATARSATTAPIKPSVVDPGEAQTVSNLTLPQVSGTPAVGAQLTATDGTWAPTPGSVGRQWLRDGAVIPGADTATYTVTAADAGHRLAFQVTARSSGYQDGVAVSAPVTIPALVLHPGAPTISGKARVGALLSAAPGAYEPAQAEVAYQWLSNGQPIAGATARTHRVDAADLGAFLSVAVTYSLDGDAAVRTSSAAGPVTATSKTTARFRRTGSRMWVDTKVVAVGVGSASGRVEVREHGDRIARSRLEGGRTSTRVQLSPGKHRLVVRYLGAGSVRSSRVVVVVRVPRR